MSSHSQSNQRIDNASVAATGDRNDSQQLLTQCLVQTDRALRTLAASAASGLLLDRYRQSTSWAQAHRRLRQVLDSMTTLYDLYTPTDKGIRLTADGLRLLCTAPLAVAFHSDVSSIEALRPFSSLVCTDDAPLSRDQFIVQQLLSADTTLTAGTLPDTIAQLSAALVEAGFSPLDKTDSGDRMAVQLLQKECVLHEQTGISAAGARHVMCYLLQREAARIEGLTQQ